VLDAVKTTATWLNSDTTSRTKMKWPCPTNYHVPTYAEWEIINNVWWWYMSWDSEWFSNTLKLPYAGYHDRNGGSMNSQWSYGYYWSSSPNISNTHNLVFCIDFGFGSYVGIDNNNYRAIGFSVRCLKN
jgi:uncharacterized protein (TIGR02145 family)